MAKFEKNKLEFKHINLDSDGFAIPEYYEVMHEGKKVLIVQRKDAYPHRWVAIDADGKQCFEPNQYRNDLFEQIEYEGVFS